MTLTVIRSSAGTFLIENLRYGSTDIIQRIQSAVRLSADEVRIEQIESAMGVGRIYGTVILNLTHFDQSRAILTLRNVSAKRLLFFALPDVARRIDAWLDVQVRTSLGREIRGAAVISGTTGMILGQTIGSFRVPIEWDLVPVQQRGAFSVRDMQAELSQGRVTGKASYEYFGDVGSRVEGDVQFANVNLQSLLKSGNDYAALGIGQATGRFEFAGRDVRSVDNLSGRLTSVSAERS